MCLHVCVCMCVCALEVYLCKLYYILVCNVKSSKGMLAMLREQDVCVCALSAGMKGGGNSGVILFVYFFNLGYYLMLIF